MGKLVCILIVCTLAAIPLQVFEGRMPNDASPYHEGEIVLIGTVPHKVSNMRWECPQSSPGGSWEYDLVPVDQ